MQQREVFGSLLAPGTLRELLMPYEDPRSVEAHVCSLPPHRFGDR
ncbi:MAG TPA: hypothetical protein PKL14_08900 [Holophaga sp.]|nr:hypothetical protein [Holophaga sp.]